jgi:hypothetical protein
MNNEECGAALPALGSWSGSISQPFRAGLTFGGRPSKPGIYCDLCRVISPSTCRGKLSCLGKTKKSSCLPGVITGDLISLCQEDPRSQKARPGAPFGFRLDAFGFLRLDDGSVDGAISRVSATVPDGAQGILRCQFLVDVNAEAGLAAPI